MHAEGGVVLLVSLWDVADPTRREEIRTCLVRNLANPSIARIHVFLDAGCTSWNDELRSERITVVPLSGYPSFATFVEYANRHLAGSIVAIANSDVFFDESLALVFSRDLAREVLALTRYNVAPTRGWNGRVWERNYGSQDAWIFRSPLEKVDSRARLGYFGCDGLFARELQEAGVLVTNPSVDVKVWHLHAERDRVTDLFAHPKSHFPGNVDPSTRRQFGFRCLPIEPLGRWKLYTIVSPSHEPLYRDYFLETMQDDFEIVARRFEQTCATAEYMSEGWTESVSRKIPLILEAIDSHPENGFFVFCDVDMQWFGPVQPRLRRLLAEQPDVDVFFQQDALRNPGGADNVCTGFFVSKSNVRTRAFWSLVGASMVRTRHGDQRTAQAIIRRNLIRGLKVAYLPAEFWGPGTMQSSPLRWSPGMFLDPPPGLLLHHANWTVGLPNKMAQLDYVARKMRLRRRRSGASAAAAPSAAEEFARTEGPVFVHANQASATPAPPKAEDRLLAVPQFPTRLPGSFWGVVLLGHPDEAHGLPAEREYRAFRESAARRGLKVLVIELPDERGMHRIGDRDADRLVRASRSPGGAPPDKAAMLALALAELPEECDKVAWLDAATPLEDEDWMRKASALLEIYRFTRFSCAGRAEAPGETDGAQGSPFQFVEFGPREIRQDQLGGVTGVAWAARRDELVAAGFAGPPVERPSGERQSKC